MGCLRDCCLCSIISIILPPLAVAIKTGCSGQLCINLCLTCCLWFPGVIHAMFVSCADDPNHGVIVNNNIQVSHAQAHPSPANVYTMNQPSYRDAHGGIYNPSASNFQPQIQPPFNPLSHYPPAQAPPEAPPGYEALLDPKSNCPVWNLISIIIILPSATTWYNHTQQNSNIQWNQIDVKWPRAGCHDFKFKNESYTCFNALSSHQSFHIVHCNRPFIYDEKRYEHTHIYHDVYLTQFFIKSMSLIHWLRQVILHHHWFFILNISGYNS